MHNLEQRAPTAAHWSASLYESLFSAAAPKRIVRIAIDDSKANEMLGFLIARCVSGDWEIENTVVENSARRNGVGSLLVRDLVDTALAAGGVSIFLEVRESNLAAVRLYESIGFKSEGRRKDYYENPKEDAILYRLPLHFCDKIP
jgi:ribosomal-protein-alanine N-acetyltransferase